ncbi:uncharacterized protein Fot_08333 [Forsythia ovata]|uniref:Uncharacterized protein n=1 Tax=Forsythia ovata TaxID=205694 RepID=A0ABD1WYC2_9LAMI
MTATTAESESVARDDQLPPLPYVTQIQFNSLETKIETLMTFLHNQTQKAAELAPKSSENHNGPPQFVEHQNAPPGIQPTGIGQGFSPPDAIPQMGPAVTPPVTVYGEADPHGMRPMVSLEMKMEEMMAQKIDDALSKRKDRRRQMVLEEDPFAPEIMAVPCQKVLSNQ